MTNPEHLRQDNDKNDAEFPPALPPEGNSPTPRTGNIEAQLSRAALDSVAINDEFWFVGRRELPNRHQNRDS